MIAPATLRAYAFGLRALHEMSNPDYEPDKPKKHSNPSSEDYSADKCPKCGVEKKAFMEEYIAHFVKQGEKEDNLKPAVSFARHVARAKKGEECEAQVFGRKRKRCVCVCVFFKHRHTQARGQEALPLAFAAAQDYERRCC